MVFRRPLNDSVPSSSVSMMIGTLALRIAFPEESVKETTVAV